MRLADVLPGGAFDASPLSRVRPGAAPLPTAVALPAVVIQGTAFVPVPGSRGADGLAGPQGLPGILVGDMDGGYF